MTHEQRLQMDGVEVHLSPGRAVLLGAEIGHNIRLTIRQARREDLPFIVGMLADDFLGAKREDPTDLTPNARVRVASHLRGVGVGHQLLWWTIAECRRRGCAAIELLSHSSRTDAHRFYETLGFTRSHVGMHLKLRPG